MLNVTEAALLGELAYHLTTSQVCWHISTEKFTAEKISDWFSGNIRCGNKAIFLYSIAYWQSHNGYNGAIKSTYCKKCFSND